jgi:hypothetical protein
MKRIFALLFFILFAIAAAHSQSFYGSQYFVGAPVNDSITSTPVSDPGPGGCYASASYTITFPVSKVTGIKYYMLVTAVSPGNSAYTTQAGTLHKGDTLPFTSNSPSYDFYFPTGGGIMYTIKAKGTPQKAGEIYPCGQFIETTSTSGCPDVVSYTFIQSATVQTKNGAVSPMAFKMVPLVTFGASSFSTITNITIDASINLKDARFELYDAYGRRVQSAAITDHAFTVSRKGIPNGQYVWKVINDKATIGLGDVIIIP